MPSKQKSKGSSKTASSAKSDKPKLEKMTSKMSVTSGISSVMERASVVHDVFEPAPAMVVRDNPAADARNMRRVIAEDPDWSLATVPLLTELCLTHIISNFANNPGMLNKLDQKSRTRVMDSLSTNLPLNMTARLVDDDKYWRRRCEARWSVCDVSQYGNRWKRMFFERNLQSIIENFVPEKTDGAELEETLSLSANYVRRLVVRQLLPPIRDGGKANDNTSEIDGSEGGDEPQVDHFDFGTVLKRLPFLEDLHMTFGVRDCGMNFEWGLFEFTTRDCQLFSRAVAACRTLRTLKLTQSKVTDDKVRLLISQLLDHPVLMELDLSHNKIEDRGARAIGKFLNNRSQLTHLDISDNGIKMTGAQAIAHALTKNTLLKVLNMRLNRIGDDGGQAMCRSLLKNSTLEELNLGSNDLMEPTAALMSQVLTHNTTIRCLDLSCNRLGPDGGKQLQEGIENNTTVVTMDLRLTECGQEALYCINQVLDKNRERQRQQQQYQQRNNNK